ncbi:MAG: phenylacetic acid degradation protein PaaN [Actinomycetota bacterium]|nr:phenylacetic acid degradation protein PaaN [Actinomycetota bacterium]
MTATAEPTTGAGDGPAANGSPFYLRHRETLERAVAAVGARDYWTPYPETLKSYGEEAEARGRAAFEAYLGAPFPLELPGSDGQDGDERSPYGFDLGITYPHSPVDALVDAARSALPAWRDAGPQTRAGVCLEILARLNARSTEIGYAVMHTTGQAFGMAFQAGGPHAQDRGLEAVAYAYPEMTRHPRSARWEKPLGRGAVAVMQKSYFVVPRGVALAVGCNTFPTWNSYPGLFASLVTGNPVIVKPHPRAVLPLAITVAVAREVLAEAGFAPDLVTLAAERPDEGLASALATHPAVRIVDFTGSTAYGDWLEEHARQAEVYTEKAGVNNVVLDSTDDFAGLAKNLAFSLSLYSGQMCTTPQNLLIPRDGIDTDEGHKSFDEVVAGIAAAVEGLLGDDKRAAAVLGAIVNDGVLERLERAPSLGSVALASRAVSFPQFPDATIRTPVLVTLDAADEKVYAAEHFGPIAFAVATGSTEESLEILRRTVSTQGALTALVYSTREDVLDAAEAAARDAGVAVSFNLTGGIYVNQSAAFSDFHGTGANPACNAALTDAAYVSSRFTMVQSRRPVPPAG